MSCFCFWLLRLCFRQTPQIRPGIEHGSDYDCRWNSFALVTLHLFLFPVTLLCFSTRGGLGTPWSALSVLGNATEMLFDVPCAYQSDVLRCLSALPSRPPCYALNKLFPFCFSSPLFLLLTVPRHCSMEEGCSSWPPRLTSEFVLVNCRASSVLLLRWQSHQALIYECSVYNLPV